jgi:hypothetical protein
MRRRWQKNVTDAAAVRSSDSDESARSAAQSDRWLVIAMASTRAAKLHCARLHRQSDRRAEGSRFRKVMEAQLTAKFGGWAPLIALQLEYSLLERTIEGELIPLALEQGLGMTPWSPLKSHSNQEF